MKKIYAFFTLLIIVLLTSCSSSDLGNTEDDRGQLRGDFFTRTTTGKVLYAHINTVNGGIIIDTLQENKNTAFVKNGYIYSSELADTQESNFIIADFWYWVFLISFIIVLIVMFEGQA